MLLGKWLQILRTETICVWSQVRATDDVVGWQMALPGQLQELLTAALITGSLGILADA